MARDQGHAGLVNRLSLRVAEPVTIGQKYRFTWPTLPEDFTFAAGHRVGIVIGANFSGYGSTNGMTQTDITVDTKLSKVQLPIVGGYDAGITAGLFSAETVPPTIGPCRTSRSTRRPTPRS